MKKYLILISLFSAVLVTLSSCGSSKKEETEKPAEELAEDIVEMRADQIKMAGIETGLIEMRSLSGILKVNGNVTVAPQNVATVCMPFGGFVKSTSLLPGNAVTKGQTLAVIENQEFIDIQQNYLEAKNKLAYAEAEYNRHNELYKEDVYSKKNLEQVTTEYKNLKAQVKALEQKLALIGINPADLHEDDISRSVSITSPINGYIKTASISLGKYVSPTDVMFEIVNGDKLLLELNLFEKDADKVSVGQKIRFFINNETEEHEALIYQTGKLINSDKTYKIYANVSGTCRNVIPGMYVNALIESESHQITSVPSQAVVTFDDKDYIFIYSRDKKENGADFTEYKMIQVEKGIEDGGFIEIRLPENFDLKTSKVVVKGAYNLLSAKKNAGEMAC